MADDRSPALPWGRPNPDAPAAIDLPAQLQLPLGSARIEVLWTLTTTDDEDAGMENVEHKWWPATLMRRAGADDGSGPLLDGQGRQVYVILYDADDGAGYAEPTEHRVSFLDDHELFDVNECDLLDWRAEGSGWTRPRPAPRMVEEPGFGLVEEMSLTEVAERGRRIDLAAGRTLRGEMAALVAGLPPEAQHGMAERLDAGLAAFAEGIAAMTAENEGSVIKLHHVEEMLDKLYARMGTTRPAAPPPPPPEP